MKENAPASEQERQKRTTSLRRWSGLVAIVVAVAVTVSFINSVYSVQKPVAGTPYDGVTLYRGLFFGSGPVASKIPTVQKALPYLPADYKSLEGQTVKYIQGKDPKFFDSFAREIQSGDRVRVAAAIKNAHTVHKEALLAITRSSTSKFGAKFGRLNTEKPPEAENDANVDVAILVVFVVLVAILWEDPPERPTALKGLSFDRCVDEVVRAVPKTAEIKTKMQ